MNSALTMNMKHSIKTPSANKLVEMKQPIKSNKKYCGVCHKAGKPANEYESHYTRSIPGPNGVITCPIILSAVCNSCGKSGHFADHCNISKSSSLSKKHSSNKMMTTIHKKPNNMFSALADYDDENPVANVKKITVTKETIKKEIRNLAPNGVSFADMLMKPAAQVKENSHTTITAAPQTNTESDNIAKILFAEKILSQRNRCSWLDSDSEAEDDYDFGDDDYDENDW